MGLSFSLLTFKEEIISAVLHGNSEKLKILLIKHSEVKVEIEFWEQINQIIACGHHHNHIEKKKIKDILQVLDKSGKIDWKLIFDTAILHENLQMIKMLANNLYIYWLLNMNILTPVINEHLHHSLQDSEQGRTILSILRREGFTYLIPLQTYFSFVLPSKLILPPCA